MNIQYKGSTNIKDINRQDAPQSTGLKTLESWAKPATISNPKNMKQRKK